MAYVLCMNAAATQTANRPRATVVQRFTDRREAMRAWEELGRWFDHALVHDPRGFDAGERVWLRSVQRLRGRVQRAG